jgi:hypothetical protein
MTPKKQMTVGRSRLLRDKYGKDNISPFTTEVEEKLQPSLYQIEER